MGGGDMKQKLLADDGTGGGRPPPFAPGAAGGFGDDDYDDREVDVPSARVLDGRDGGGGASAPTRTQPRRAVDRDAGPARQQGGGGGGGGVRGGGGGDVIHMHGNPTPQIVIIREPYRVYDDGVCCPLLTFILGFSFPFIWLLGCCQTASNNPSARFLARCSIVAFLVTSLMSSGFIFSSLAKDGKWPWDTGCFFPWDKKC